MADLLTYTYPSGTKEFVPISKGTSAQHNSIYRGEELQYTWAEIKTKITNNDFSNLYIGDYKTITLTTNETVVMEIAGINNYADWGSTQISKHIDFISRDCLATAYKFNETNTNNGTPGSKNPYQASALYTTLNDETSGVISTLPSDLISVILTKYGYYEERWSSGGAVSADTGAAWKQNKLWIPSEIEVFGHATWSEIGYGTAGFQQYPIFWLNPSKITKGNHWWTLSADKGSSAKFITINRSGVPEVTPASLTVQVPLCFRVA